MLLHSTLEKLSALRLTGMFAALHEQRNMNDIDDLGFEERLGLLLDREQALRDTRRMQTRLHKAKLRQDGAIEDIDFRHPRGLDKSLVLRLADCRWIKEHNNLIITGPTGVGKSYLACAFAHKVQVRRSFKNGRFARPKNGKSRRVDLSNQCIQALTSLRKQRMADSLASDGGI